MRWLFPYLILISRLLGVTPLPSNEVMIIGRFSQGPVDQAIKVDAAGFNERFGSDHPAAWPAEMQARQFFRNGGRELEIVRLDPSIALARSLPGNFTPPALAGAGWTVPFPDLGILLIPELAELSGSTRDSLLNRLLELADERHFILLLDPPISVDTTSEASAWAADLPQNLDFAALLYPHVLVDPGVFSGRPGETLTPIGASGSTAALVLRNDVSKGIWDPPAGTSASLIVDGLATSLSSNDASTLNSENICTIREISSYGIVLFGWRSRDTIDLENRFLSVARLRRWASHSLRRGLSGSTAITSNQTPLWSQLEFDTATFLDGLFRAGAFAGTTPNEAYFSNCGTDTTSPSDIAANRVHLTFGFAPLSPAEFQVVTLPFDTADPARPVPVGHLVLAIPGDDTLRLFHSTSPGFTHRVQTSTLLDTGNWTNLTTHFGDGGWRTSVQLFTPGRRFFRLDSQ